MMDKIAARHNGTNSNLRFIRAEEEDKVEIFMTDIIITEEITKIDIYQIVVTKEISIDKLVVDWGVNKIMGEEILEAMWDCIKILEGLGKGHFQGITIIIEGMTEVYVIVDQGQDQEWAQIEIELGAISVENMIISWKTVMHLRKKER